MRQIKVLLGLLALALAVVAGYQITAAVIANMALQEDMHDMASQAGARVGMLAPPSDEELVRNIVGKAKDRGIEVDPAQITVRRTTSGLYTTIYLAADYRRPISMGLFSFPLHFTPSSDKA